MKWAGLFVAFLVSSAGNALAHEVRPAYLELRQTSAETYKITWKVPGRGEDLRLALYVELPSGSVDVTERRGVFVNSAYIERWNFVLGAIFVLIVVFMPEGLVPGTRHLGRFIRSAWRPRAAGLPAPGGEAGR